MEEAILVETTDAGLFQSRVTTPFASFIVDEPAEVGGLASGPTPYDLLSAALGACTAMTIRLYLQHKKLPQQHVAVRVTHDRQGLNGKDRFLREIELAGDFTSEQMDRILNVSKHCPVHKTIEGGADVETRIVTSSVKAPLVSHCAHEEDCEEAVASG